MLFRSQALLSNGSSVYWASVNSSVIAAPGSNGNILVSLSNSIYASNGLSVNTSTNTVSIGNTSVNATINSTAYTGSANNATNLGGAPYTAYVNTSGSFTVGGILTYNANLVVNTGNYIVLGNTSVNAIVNSTVYSGTSNNATNLGGTAASGYQTTAGLSANVLILTSNNTSYVGSSPASSIVNATSLAANLSYYSTTTIVQGWISGNSATAYSNAVSYAASAAATAYSNAVSYAPSKTGSGASGTWPINISGSAATLSGYTNNQNLGTSNDVQFNSIGVGTPGSGTTGEIRATNQITAYYSDIRLKTDITPIENALDKIMKISGVYYRSNDVAEYYGYTDKRKQVGVLAQQIEAVLPEIVVPAPFDIAEDGSSKSGENYKTVHYEKLVALLIEAIKEQQKQIDEIKNRG